VRNNGLSIGQNLHLLQTGKKPTLFGRVTILARTQTATPAGLAAKTGHVSGPEKPTMVHTLTQNVAWLVMQT